MNKFDRKYEAVKRLSRVGEVGEFNSITTSLYDWMKDGNCDGVPVRTIAREWDELNGIVAEKSKRRTEYLATVARTIIERDAPEQVMQGGKLLPMAKTMMQETGCNIDTAKNHLARQLRLMRGEFVKVQRGGAREGAGRPLKDE